MGGEAFGRALNDKVRRHCTAVKTIVVSVGVHCVILVCQSRHEGMAEGWGWRRGWGPSLSAGAALALRSGGRLRSRADAVTHERAGISGGSRPSSIRNEVRRPGRSVASRWDRELGLGSVRTLEEGKGGEAGRRLSQFRSRNEGAANEGRGDLAVRVLRRVGVEPELQDRALAAGLLERDRRAVEARHHDFVKLELEEGDGVRDWIVAPYELVGELEGGSGVGGQGQHSGQRPAGCKTAAMDVA